MNYTLSDLFYDKNNFFNNNTLLFLSMLIVLNLFDYFTTVRAVLSGVGKEANPIIAYLLNNSPSLYSPFLLGLYKIGVFILYVYILKIIYDMMQDTFKDHNIKKYNFVFLYIMFTLDILISFIVIINNLVVLAL